MTSAFLIGQKHINEITIEDLESLVDVEAAESDRLELKRDLSLSTGAKGWRDTGNLHRSETRAIAKEVVALANSYGGRVCIGIDETLDDPKRAASLADPLPNAAALAERLGDGLNGLISPPLKGLTLRAVPVPGSSNAGYVVIDVPRSLDAPHGFGTPPECYWRRGSSSQPMEMRDLQHLFWDTRTRIERIHAEQRAAAERFEQLPLEAYGLKYRFTLVSLEPLALNHLTQNFRDGAVVPPTRCAPVEGCVAEYPLWRNDDWTFSAAGTVKSEKKTGSPSTEYIWEVDETGIIEVRGQTWIDPNSEMMSFLVEPRDYCATVAHLLYLATFIRRFANQPLDQWVLDGQFKSAAPQLHLRAPAYFRQPVRFDLSKGVSFRPVALSVEDSTEAVFIAFEERIWAAFGQPVADEGRYRYKRP